MGELSSLFEPGGDNIVAGELNEERPGVALGIGVSPGGMIDILCPSIDTTSSLPVEHSFTARNFN
jgi:hypothetical protein